VSAANADIVNFVNVGGTRYATLDDADPWSWTVGCQTGAATLPTGWTLAKAGTLTTVAIRSFRWATECVVLSNGASFTTHQSISCGTGYLTGTATAGYTVAGCNRRILISQPGQGMLPQAA
jgi:hypothetical protein